MTNIISVDQDEVESLYQRTLKNASVGGYILNPDNSFTFALIGGLAVNRKRYGYESCPCRLASGSMETDRDIICPCDYRDDDVAEFGACYCALYVSRDIAEGKRKLKPIPERRKPVDKISEADEKKVIGNLKYPVWRCSVCGYLCARNSPPEICPICKVTKERFEKFI